MSIRKGAESSDTESMGICEVSIVSSISASSEELAYCDLDPV